MLDRDDVIITGEAQRADDVFPHLDVVAIAEAAEGPSSPRDLVIRLGSLHPLTATLRGSTLQSLP